MERYELSKAEQLRRQQVTEHTRQMLLDTLEIQGTEGLSLMTQYKGYYLQLSFSVLHPLLVICLARVLHKASTPRQREMANALNLNSILGSHALNDDIGCYSYRATQWLDAELDAHRFFEILDRCIEEADRGFHTLQE